MFFVPGILISFVTFPGVIVHELAHQVFCCLMGVPVYEVRYFQFSNPCGYVLHERSDRPLVNFMISTGPFLVNTLLGALLLLPVSLEMFRLGSIFGTISGSNLLVDVPKLLAVWLGVSILMHAFPSTGDAKVMIDTILKNPDVNLLVKVLVAPVVGLIYLGAIGSMVWLDLGYAVGIAFLLPNLFGLFI